MFIQQFAGHAQFRVVIWLVIFDTPEFWGVQLVMN